MNVRWLLAVLFLACCLTACDTYDYSFNTFIADDGTVTRTVDFQYEPYKKRAARPVKEAGPDGEDAEEVELGMPARVVMPDRERFFKFELVEHGWHGAWQSEGTIYTDFRFTVPSYTVRGKANQRIPRRLRQPKRQREAYNEGVVTFSDLVLVRTFAYTERFHDYYTRDELDEYADIAIDRLGDFFLEVLHKDLGRQYDLRAFDAYLEEQVIPFAKKWKTILYPSLLNEHGIWDLASEDLLSNLRSPELLEMGRELMARGGLEAPYLDRDRAIMVCWDWLRLSMHRLIMRKRDKAPWSLDEIDAYFDVEAGEFDEPGFFPTARRLIEKRYGDEDALTRRLLAVWDSFAQTGSDSHHFEMAVGAPGVLIHASPRPDVITPLGNRTSVRWFFENDHFFPDGVQLSLITAAPAANAQERLFGAVVLDDTDEIARYVALFAQLPNAARAALLAGLRESIRMGDIEELYTATHDRLPHGYESHENERVDEMIDFLENLVEADSETDD